MVQRLPVSQGECIFARIAGLDGMTSGGGRDGGPYCTTHWSAGM